MNTNKLKVLFTLALAAAAAGCEVAPEGLDTETPEVDTETSELQGATTCNAVIAPHMTWMANGGGYFVTYRLVGHENTRNGLVSYANGSFDTYRPATFYFDYYQGYVYVPATMGAYSTTTQNGTQLFSDRTVNCGTRSCAFDPARGDSINVRIDESGRIRITLITWGNGVIDLEPSECKGNVIHAYGNGVLYTITLADIYLG